MALLLLDHRRGSGVLHAGETLSVLSDQAQEVDRVPVADDVPLPYHKVALSAIDRGDPILKYGEVIGYATAPIARGEWVHLHNVESVNYGQTQDERPATNDQVWGCPSESDHSSSVAHTNVGRPSTVHFWGYPRPDGQVGVRNHLLVMATCDCAYEEAKNVDRDPGCSDEFKQDVKKFVENLRLIKFKKIRQGMELFIDAPKEDDSAGSVE